MLNKNLVSSYPFTWVTHTLTIGYRHTGNTGEEYGYLANTMGSLIPDDQKLIAKQYRNTSGQICYFVSYTNNRVEGYIAFSPSKEQTFHFSYKDNQYDNKACWEAFKARNGQTVKIYLSTEPPEWY